MNGKTALVYLGVCVAPWVVACGPETTENVSAQSLAVTAQANTEAALRGLSTSATFVAESASLAKALSAFSQDTECGASLPAGCVPGTTDCEPPVTVCETQDSVQVADLQDSHAEIEEGIESIVRELKEKIFVAANLESETSTSATYLLGPSVLCESDAEPTNAGSDAAPAPAPSVDSDCVEQAQKLAIRLRLSPLGKDGVSVALLLTSQQRNPLTLELEPARAALNLDLAELQGSLEALGEDTGSVQRMSGKLRAEILKKAERHYGLSLSVLQALALEVENDQGETIAVSLGQSSPTFELGIDGGQRRLTARVDYGAFGLRGPLSAFRDSFEDAAPSSTGEPVVRPVYTGNIDLSVAGLEGAVTLDGNQDHLKLTGLGLGDAPSTLKFDGTTLLEANLNPNAGRHFDVEIQSSGERSSMSFSSVDLSLLMNFAPLVSQIADIPKFMLNDSLRFLLSGEKPTLQFEQDQSGLSQVRLVSGSLSMTSQSQPDMSVLVSPGNCLLESGVEDPGHELLGAFAAGACAPTAP